MKNLILLFLILISGILHGQNLVQNSSFEDTIICPNSLGQMDRALYWTSYRNTPDYFNSCNTSIAGVPSNFAGYQNAHTGSAYAGLHTYVRNGNNYREWIGSQLIEPLIIGRRYLVSFFASQGYKPTSIGLASNKLGIRLSTVSYTSTNQLPLNGYTHLHTDSIIADTSNWIEITGSFIADSSYEYIVIGNFFNDTLTSIVSSDTALTFAYYYIDDISVRSIDSIWKNVESIYEVNKLSIYPNPANKSVQIEGLDIQKISVYNTFGQLCLIRSVSERKIKLDVSDFNSGIYYIYIETTKENFNQKIIIQSF